MSDAEIVNYWNANKDQPAVIQAKLDEVGRTPEELAELTGEDVVGILAGKPKRAAKKDAA